MSRRPHAAGPSAPWRAARLATATAALLAACGACSGPAPIVRTAAPPPPALPSVDPQAPLATARAELALDGAWELAPGVGFDAPPADGWRPVQVPEAIDAHLGRTQAFYRLAWEPPAGLLQGRRATLRFERAAHHVRVWLDGRLVGEHWGSRLPFEVVLEPGALREGELHELVVGCHAPDVEHARPGGVGTPDEAKAYGIYRLSYAHDAQGWLPAGLLGGVRLVLGADARAAIKDVHVPPYERAGEQPVEVTLSGDVVRGRDEVRVELLTPEGRLLDEAREAATPGPDGTTRVRLRVGSDALLPWDPDAPDGPALYALRATLVGRDGELDRTTLRFGHRRYEVADGTLRLGGVPRTLLGTASGVEGGRARTLALLDALRGVGVNALHTHWDDPGDDLWALCDEAGVYLVPGFYCAGPPHATWPVEAASDWLSDTAERAHAWSLLRRNHPSACLWAPVDIPPQRYRGFEEELQPIVDALALAPGQLVLGRDVVPLVEGTSDVLLEDGFGEKFAPALARARTERRPIVVAELADLAWKSADEMRRLFTLFSTEPVAGVFGNHLEWRLFEARPTGPPSPLPPAGLVPPPVATSVPALASSRSSTTPPTPGEARWDRPLYELFNWTDPAQPTHVTTEYGRALAAVAEAFHGCRLPPLRFLRSPELRLHAPAGLAGRLVLVEPLEGPETLTRGARLDAHGTAALVLPFPGRYRVRAPGHAGAVTVEAHRTPWTGRAGDGHVLDVALP